MFVQPISDDNTESRILYTKIPIPGLYIAEDRFKDRDISNNFIFLNGYPIQAVFVTHPFFAI